MTLNRRDFIGMSGIALASVAAKAEMPKPHPDFRPRAIVFDAFPIFDPRSVKAAIGQTARDAPAELYETWRNRIFEYQWLRALSGRYVDFEACAVEALDFATTTLKVDLSSSDKRALVGEFSNLRTWADVDEGLASLAASGVKLGFLSNMTERMLRSNAEHNGIAKRFDFVLSTDRVRSFKPDPRAYELACASLKLAKSDILFVAFAAWDVAGAKWFGFPTYWVNRANARAELGVTADGESADFAGLVRFVRDRAGSATAR